MKGKKKIIGRLEEISLPEFKLFGLDAKIDTGADSCSIHCLDIREDKGTLFFKLLDSEHREFRDKELAVKEYKKVKVRGAAASELRYKIKSKLGIGSKTYVVSFTLSDRSKMKYPILLGRNFLKRKFLVDVSEKYLLKGNEKL